MGKLHLGLHLAAAEAVLVGVVRLVPVQDVFQLLVARWRHRLNTNFLINEV